MTHVEHRLLRTVSRHAAALRPSPVRSRLVRRGWIYPRRHLWALTQAGRDALVQVEYDRVVPLPKRFVKRWTPGMKGIAAVAKRIGEQLLRRRLRVRFIRNPREEAEAMYAWSGGRRRAGVLIFNLHFVRPPPRVDVQFQRKLVELLLHEFAHERVEQHSDPRFADEVGHLGATAVMLALKEPEVFQP